MDDKTAETLARSAGLDRAWNNHRADVLDALATLERHRRNLPRVKDETQEPVPAWAPRP
ncbi:MAG: hypothetical protein NTW56_20390 [Alphaproteobacteria bacterium]|jgi:hypothetical protein|nr:hypothetical protein [Alphaproteobacteria bacterium]